MAKKKRSKRLKKLAKVLGAGLAIAGLGRAFANRNARASTDADTVKLMTTDEAYKIPGGDENSFKVQNVPSESVNLSRMTGSGPNSGLTGQEIRADYAQRMRNAVTGVDGPPSVLNPYTSRAIKGRLTNRGNTFKSGGRVGVGKAKRGFGKAMKKGGKK
tara:strand:+ start:38 stop:514 length:477 start_codon:yes stop_codon:yes gene_type:complete